jgi:prophage regulatory protein
MTSLKLSPPSPSEVPPAAASPSRKQIIRIAGVMALSGIGSKSTLYRLISEGRFPKPVKLSVRASGWYLHEVDFWINSRRGA